MRLGVAGRGASRRGLVRHGSRGKVPYGGVWQGSVRLGVAVTARHDVVSRGLVWQLWHGALGPGSFRQVQVWPVMAVPVRLGKAMCGSFGLGRFGNYLGGN